MSRIEKILTSFIYCIYLGIFLFILFASIAVIFEQGSESIIYAIIGFSIGVILAVIRSIHLWRKYVPNSISSPNIIVVIRRIFVSLLYFLLVFVPIYNSLIIV